MINIHTFAIGDIHGRADLLERLLGAIEDRASRLEAPYQIVFLGDIVDRGPDSRQAMNLVSAALARIPGSRLILGNHDSFILRILDEADQGRKQALLLHWVAKMGGGTTLASYGCDFSDTELDRILDVIDAGHLNMLRAAENHVELDGHILVHAGLDPAVSLERQDPYKMMWIREPFLSHQGSFGKIVVHGHTVTTSGSVERFHGRIAVDTGAYDTSILSVLHIRPDGSESVLQAVSDNRSMVTVMVGRILDIGHREAAPCLQGRARNA